MGELSSAASVPAVRAAIEAGRPDETWLVGGAVRHLIQGKAAADVDFATKADPEPLARGMARIVGGHVFPLPEKLGAWRVIAADRGWQAALTPLRGASIA